MSVFLNGYADPYHQGTVISAPQHQDIPRAVSYNASPFTAQSVPGPLPSPYDQAMLPGQVQSTAINTIPNYLSGPGPPPQYNDQDTLQLATTSMEPNNVSVMQTMVAADPNMNDPADNEYSVQIKCPNCRLEITTSTEYVNGSCTYMFCLLLACIGWLPFVTSSAKDVVHTCPSCKAVCGRFRRKQIQMIGIGGRRCLGTGQRGYGRSNIGKNKRSFNHGGLLHNRIGVGRNRRTGISDHRRTNIGSHRRTCVGGVRAKVGTKSKKIRRH